MVEVPFVHAGAEFYMDVCSEASSLPTIHHVRGLRYVAPYVHTQIHWPRDCHADKSLAQLLSDSFGGPKDCKDGSDPGGEEQPSALLSAVPYWSREVDAGRVMLKTKKLSKQDPDPPFRSVPPTALVGKQSQIRVVRHVHERITPAGEPIVLHEDSAMLVVNKPGGVPVQDDIDGNSGVLNLVKRARPELTTLRPAHRLDIGTSGALVLGKGGGNSKRLMKEFEEHRVHKVYLARVRGHLASVPMPDSDEQTRGTWQAGDGGSDADRWRIVEHSQSYISRDGRAYVVADDAIGAKRCRTDVRAVLGGTFADGTSLVECRLHSGRRHQIRCCLASLGVPIANDEQYGGSRHATAAGEAPTIYTDDEHGTLRRVLEANAQPWCAKCAWCLAAVRGEVEAPPAPQPVFLHARVCEFLPDGPRIEAPLPLWATDTEGETISGAVAVG